MFTVFPLTFLMCIHRVFPTTLCKRLTTFGSIMSISFIVDVKVPYIKHKGVCSLVNVKIDIIVGISQHFIEFLLFL